MDLDGPVHGPGRENTGGGVAVVSLSTAAGVSSGMPSSRPPPSALPSLGSSWALAGQDRLLVWHPRGCGVCAAFALHTAQARVTDDDFNRVEGDAVRDLHFSLWNRFRAGSDPVEGGSGLRARQQLETENAVLLQEVQRLQQERDAQTVRIAELEEGANAAFSKLENASERVATLERTIADLQDWGSDITRQNRRLEDSRNDLRDQLSRAEAALEEFRRPRRTRTPPRSRTPPPRRRSPIPERGPSRRQASPPRFVPPPNPPRRGRSKSPRREVPSLPPTRVWGRPQHPAKDPPAPELRTAAPDAVARPMADLKASMPSEARAGPSTPVVTSYSSAMDVDKEVGQEVEPPRRTMPLLYTDWDAEDDDEDEDSDPGDSSDEHKRLLRAKVSHRKAKDPLPPLRPRSEYPGTPSAAEPPTMSAAPPKWPTGFPLPAITSPFLAGKWFEFVPRFSRDARHIVKAAQDGDDGAVWRVRHLLEQSSRDTRLGAVDGMYSLQQTWRNPRRPSTQNMGPARTEELSKASVVNPSGRPSPLGSTGQAPRDEEGSDKPRLPNPTPGMLPPAGPFPDPSSRKRKGKGPQDGLRDQGGSSSSAAPQEPAAKKRKGLAAPRRGDPPEVWQVYWKTFPQNIHPAARLAPDGTPNIEDVRAFIVIRALAAASRSADSRKSWLIRADELFSVAGLYAEYVRRRHITIAPNVAALAYPYDGSNVTWGDIARWFATNGHSPDSQAIREIEAFCRRARNLDAGRSPEDDRSFVSVPQDLPSEVQRLDIEDARIAAETASEDVTMADTLPSESAPANPIPPVTSDGTVQPEEHHASDD